MTLTARRSGTGLCGGMQRGVASYALKCSGEFAIGNERGTISFEMNVSGADRAKLRDPRPSTSSPQSPTSIPSAGSLGERIRIDWRLIDSAFPDDTWPPSHGEDRYRFVRDLSAGSLGFVATIGDAVDECAYEGDAFALYSPDGEHWQVGRLPGRDSTANRAAFRFDGLLRLP